MIKSIDSFLLCNVREMGTGPQKPRDLPVQELEKVANHCNTVRPKRPVLYLHNPSDFWIR
jgi:hypothetical protein